MYGISREQLGSILMDRHGKTSMSALDNNGDTPYCIYGVRSYQLEQFNELKVPVPLPPPKEQEWKPNALLKCGKAGSIIQRMRQYEQVGCHIKCEWVIWTSAHRARYVENYVHDLLRPYRFMCTESIATETFSINTDNSFYIANIIKKEICNRRDVLGMDIFLGLNHQSTKFRDQSQSTFNEWFYLDH